MCQNVLSLFASHTTVYIKGVISIKNIGWGGEWNFARLQGKGQFAMPYPLHPIVKELTLPIKAPHHRASASHISSTVLVYYVVKC